MERHCKNCDRLLYASQDYCPGCGSEWIDYRLTPKRITAEFTERYFATDNRFLITILHLLSYPENVINGYITGQRKKYVNPASFYFISLTLLGLQIFLMKTFSPELLGFTEELEKTSLKGYLDYFYDYMGLFTAILIPVYAASGLIIFSDIKKYNFTEHLIFFIYLYGLSNIIVSLFTPVFIIFKVSFQTSSIILGPLSLIQIGWYYKRCFKLTLTKSIIKTILMFLLYNVFQFILLLFVAVIAIGIIYLFNPEFLGDIKIT